MGNRTPRRNSLRWSWDVARGILLTGCNTKTYRSGHRAKLEPDRNDAISYSTRNCRATVANLKVMCPKARDSEAKTRRSRAWQTISLVPASSWRAPDCEAQPLFAANGTGGMNAPMPRLVCTK